MTFWFSPDLWKTTTPMVLTQLLENKLFVLAEKFQKSFMFGCREVEAKSVKTTPCKNCSISFDMIIHTARIFDTKVRWRLFILPGFFWWWMCLFHTEVTSAPLLNHPDPVNSSLLRMMLLIQGRGSSPFLALLFNRFHPCAFHSRCLWASNYDVGSHRLLAVKHTCWKWRRWLNSIVAQLPHLHIYKWSTLTAAA